MRVHRYIVLAAMAAIGVVSGSSVYALPGQTPGRHAPALASTKVAQSNTCHFVYFAGKTQDGRGDTCLRCVTGYYSASTWTTCPVRQVPNTGFVQCEPWAGGSAASPGSLCASPYPTPAAGLGPAPEAATTEMVSCNGKNYYIYAYLNRPAFRAVLPPNWSQAIGGRDFPTRQQAVDAACGVSGGTIRITSATLGANCRAPHGNVTTKLAAICNGKEECNPTGHDVNNPDPAQGCPKDFAAEWQCTGQAGIRSNAIPATPDETTTLKLSCKTGSTSTGGTPSGGINMLGVPYGGGATTGGGNMTTGPGRATANTPQAQQVFSQGEQRDQWGRITREEARIHVLTCSGSNRQIYIYEYLRRPGFRAINPPDWSHPLGGRDFGSYIEALQAGCGGFTR